VVTAVSGILFLGYAKVGSRSDLEVPAVPFPAFGRHGLPADHPSAAPSGAQSAPSGAQSAQSGAQSAQSGAQSAPPAAAAGRHGRPWWEH
jgi:hypothetical protein